MIFIQAIVLCLAIIFTCTFVREQVHGDDNPSTPILTSILWAAFYVLVNWQ